MDLKILEIASNTKNHKVIKNYTHQSKNKNPLCGDEMEISLIIKDNVVQDILGFSNKFVFFVISTILDKKTLDDGRNVHQTVKSEDWWKSFFLKFKKHSANLDVIVMLTNLGKNSDIVKRII